MPVFAPIQGPPTKGVQRCGSYAHGLRMAKLTHEYHRESVQGVSFSISAYRARWLPKELRSCWHTSHPTWPAQLPSYPSQSYTVTSNNSYGFTWFYNQMITSRSGWRWRRLCWLLLIRSLSSMTLPVVCQAVTADISWHSSHWQLFNCAGKDLLDNHEPERWIASDITGTL